MRNCIALLVALFLPLVAYAQLGAVLVPFAPKDCFNDAKNIVGAGNNPRLVALVNPGLTVPIGTDNVSIGLSTKDGKARAWFYVFISGPQDTIASVAMVRAVAFCQDPSALVGGAFDPPEADDFPTIPLPANFVEGQALATALNGNAEFKKFSSAHPDSMPGVSVLTTSPEAGLGFPANTPFWVLNWTDLANPNPGGQEPFICLVHATTGQTLCGQEITLSVSELNDPSVFLAPNPVRDNALFNLPIAWIGRPVDIDAVSTSGSIIPLMQIGNMSSPAVAINASQLGSGAYMLRARSGNSQVLLPMTVLR